MSAIARYIVDAIVLEQRSPTQLACDHGLSRSWIYCLLQRFREGGYEALEPRSRRPHSCSHQAADAVQAEVLRLRAELLAAGHDGGPRPSSITWPSVSTSRPRSPPSGGSSSATG